MAVGVKQELYSSRLRACSRLLCALCDAVDGQECAIDDDPKFIIESVIAELTEDNHGFEVAAWVLALTSGIGRERDDK